MKRILLNSIVSFLVGLLFKGEMAHAQVTTIVIPAPQGTASYATGWVASDLSSKNSGDLLIRRSSTSPSNGPGYMRFDLASSGIPSGATVSAVTVTFIRQGSGWTGAASIIGGYATNASNTNDPPTATISDLSTALKGSTNWNTNVPIGVGTNPTFNMTLGANGISAVQNYLNGGANNIIVLALKESNGGVSGPTTVTVYGYDNATVSNRPYLSVTYTNPTCSSPCQSWINMNCTTCSTGCNLDAGIVTPTPVLQMASMATSTSNFGYLFWTFNAEADSTYYFDLCSSTGTAGVTWLRLHSTRHTSPSNNYCMDGSNTPTLVIQNRDNGCVGTGTGLSKLIWTCRVSGTYYLESALDASRSQWGASGNQTALLSYKTLPSDSYTCSNVFYDKGIDGTDGASSSYNNNEDWIYTYYPIDTITEAISVQFTSFSTSPGDILCVYNGNSVNAPLIGCYSGPSITGAFSSSASDGSLTFHFTSDDSLISSGWQANVSCVSNVGIRNNVSAEGVKVYPSPFGNQLIIADAQYSILSTEIFNALGEKVYSSVVNSKLETINTKQFAPGLYYIKVQTEKGINIQKIIKQ